MSEQSRKGLYYRESRGRSFRPRWDVLQKVADFRPTDHVLDIGCAEGLITLEVATLVERVHGIDAHENRVAEATRLAAESGIRNAAFELASVVGYPLRPRSYDVSLLMAGLGKAADDGDTERWVGVEDLRRILEATRRQSVMRLDDQHKERRRREPRLGETLEVCEQSGFDALCFSLPIPHRKSGKVGGNMLIANRRGSDARVGKLPRLALIPISRLPEHPVVRSLQSLPGPISRRSQKRRPGPLR